MASEGEAQIINRIKALASKDGFSEDETDAILNHVKIFTGKIIRDYLLAIADEELKDKDATKFKELTDEIMKIDVPNHVGCEKIQIKNLDNVVLIIQIGIANKDTHTFDILYPNMDVLKAIFFRIKKFMEMTNGYYKQMMSINKNCYQLLCNYISDIDFSQLRLNYNTWTMAFAEKSIMRIVPVVYYTDNKGRPVKLDDVDHRQPKSVIPLTQDGGVRPLTQGGGVRKREPPL